MLNKAESDHWQRLLATDYGIIADLYRLDGEFDLNVAVEVKGKVRWVLKIMRPDCEAGLVEMQVAALNHVRGADPDLPIPDALSSPDLLRITLAEYEKMGGPESLLDIVRSSQQAKTVSSSEPPRRPTSLLAQFKAFTVRDWIVFVAKGICGVVIFLIAIIFASSIFGAWLGSVLIIALLIGVVYKVASLLMAS